METRKIKFSDRDMFGDYLYPMSFFIEKDYLDGERDGKLFKQKVVVPASGEEIEVQRRWFKAYDDDGELYYSGWFDDDEWSEGQMGVLDFFMFDSGCTKLEVADEKNGHYDVEVG